MRGGCTQVPQHGREHGYGFRLVCSEVLHDVLLACARTVPLLLRRVRADGEHPHVVPAGRGRLLLEDDGSVGFVEAGEVPEVGRLAELVAAYSTEVSL